MLLKDSNVSMPSNQTYLVNLDLKNTNIISKEKAKNNTLNTASSNTFTV